MVIEVFGDYWHKEKPNIPIFQTDYGRKAIFRRYGYQTLIIWENEINNLCVEEIVEKIRLFLSTDVITRVIE